MLDDLGLDKPFERKVIQGGQTQGFVNVQNSRDRGFDVTLPRKVYRGSEYAIEYQKEEEEEEERMAASCSSAMGRLTFENGFLTGKMSEVEELTSMGTVPNVEDFNEDLTQVYECYNFERHNLDQTPKLAVFGHQDKVLKMIHANPVVIIKGNTGCGKSTQVPQMILDNYVNVRQHCNIIVTQPRRIAAISVAKRVCKERNWAIGSVVGYQVGLDRTVGEHTRLTYCTTGVLLQKLVVAKNLNDYTHVILDEVHERSQEMDFLMLLVKKFQRTVSKNVKIILMSATINTDPYSQYFSKLVNGIREDTPVVEIGLVSNFKVSTYYLEGLEPKLGPFPVSKDSKPSINEEAYEFVVNLIKAFDYIDSREKPKKGSVLVFLPGILEIENLFEALQSSKNDSQENFQWWICPLHSTITADEQLKVFLPPPLNSRKIILSTNIAESSITVPDIKYVVDFCLTKTMILDKETNLQCLTMSWASKSQCVQRAGRVGRVMEGRVYRLLHQHAFNALESESTPDILHSSLEITVLKAKQLNMGPPKKILALAMDPPDLTQLEKTILKLKEVGAILMTVDGVYDDLDGDMTQLGRIMAALPIDTRMTKLILLGHVFSVLDEAIIMACSMTVKSMFSRPFQKDLQAYISKLTWADSSCSDPIACRNAYHLWRRLKTSGKFNLSAGGGDKVWAGRFFIQLNAMREVGRLQEEIQTRLKAFNIEETKGPNRVKWGAMTPLILKMVLAGAFYPYYYMRSQEGGQVDEREAVKVLGGRDPFNTVYLTNFPVDQPAQLYISAVKSFFVGCGVPRDNIRVSYDNSCKLYVEFKAEMSSNEREDDRQMSYVIPGKISMAVYRALKLRNCHNAIPLEIPMLPHDESKRRVELQISQKNKKKTEEKSILPSLSTTCIEISISDIKDPGCFYVQYTERDSWEKLKVIQQCLNGVPHTKARTTTVNELYAAPYEEKGVNVISYFRGKVIERRNRVVKVLFIDYGNVELMDESQLCILKSSYKVETTRGKESMDVRSEPALAFCCTLSQVQPSVYNSYRAGWSGEAINEFKRLCHGKSIMAKVYSVVDNVASLDLYIPQVRNTKYSVYNASEDMYQVSKHLVERKLAEWSEESYLSKLNHDLRNNCQLTEDGYDYTKQDKPLMLDFKDPWDDKEMPSPLKHECRGALMRLKGPYSPLEMKVYSSLRSSSNKTIGIEKDSVNSVLLDTHPQDPHERMLVAASVGQNSQGERHTLRYTTMLPNIHGLPALLCLIFAPFVELRVDEDMTRLTGALCGLGYDPETQESYFPENDLEVSFDTVFTNDQIILINKLRYKLSRLLAPEDESASDDKYHYVDIDVEDQKNIETFILESFKMLANQKPERVQASRYLYKWGLVDEQRLMYPGIDNEPWLIYPLIYGVDINDDSNAVNDRRTRIFTRNINMMKEIAAGKQPLRPGLMCELCQVTIDNIQSLRLHFQSTQHVQLAARFNIVDK